MSTPSDPAGADIPRSPTGRVPKWVMDEAIKNSPEYIASHPTPPPAPKQKPRKEKPVRDYDDGLRESGDLQTREYTYSRRTRLIAAGLFFAIPLGIALLTGIGPR